MCISTEIASKFPVPIPIQKINDIYCYNPMFHTKNNLVIIIMHIYIIIINVLFYYFKNSNELFLNSSDLILPIAIVYVVGLV